MTEKGIYLDLDTDNTLGGNNPSDVYVPSQKAVKTYVDNNSGTVTSVNNVSPVNGNVQLTSSNIGAVSTSDLYLLDLQTVPVVISEYVNGTSWYRIWSSGWCEQGGQSTGGSTVGLLKTYRDTNFSVIVSHLGSGAYGCGITANSSQISVYCSSSGGYVQWQTAGYLAEGEY